MKNILTSIFISTSIILTAQAQEDIKAKTILDELSAKTKSYSSITAVFSYNLENKASKTNETQEGKLFVKGNKYKLEIAGQEVISDGKTVWTYLREANEVQINNPPDASAQDAVNPANLFTIYETGFQSKFDCEKVDGKKTFQHINLYPKDPKKKSYHTVKLTIDKQAKEITNIKVLGKDGNDYTYSVRNFTPNQILKDDIFSFDKTKYPKIEVVDLR